MSDDLFAPGTSPAAPDGGYQLPAVIEKPAFVLGLNEDMSNEDYQAADAISKSKLDAIAPECKNSPRHYWAKYIDPDREPEERTEALILGDAIHKAILEPDLVSQHIVVVPEEAPRKPSVTQLNAKNPSLESRGSIDWWTAFWRENKGKTILKPEQMKVVLGCRDSVHMNPLLRGLLTGGYAEQSYFALDRETGAPVKCRLDYDRLELCGQVVDIKSTEDASEDGFGRSATKYRYDVQGDWYPDVLESAYGLPVVESFVFIAVEKEWPHACGLHFLTPEDQAEAHKLARRDFHRILECTRTGVWPDFANEPRPLRIRRRRSE